MLHESFASGASDQLVGHVGAGWPSNLSDPILLSTEWFSTLSLELVLLLPLPLPLLMLHLAVDAVAGAGGAANTCWSAVIAASC